MLIILCIENRVISKTNRFLSLIIINKYNDFLKGEMLRWLRKHIVEGSQ